LNRVECKDFPAVEIERRSGIKVPVDQIGLKLGSCVDVSHGREYCGRRSVLDNLSSKRWVN
jgi:hypothetical protein